ncbi:receptor-like serine/threonine-protein kinase ALE2 isoform X2 [Macadamia integrifolia]|uniref:receptor-like serine/threonine-protein kinase ALE2 isoform X2 n=1 Tax=Macadamia integrifolia TaxID=60698 RepID=UPI001C4FA0FE|nr:receptor-like serine/threonine-protein kinase ALE2 isoform X2 [Macadamia integrifolia]
MLSLMILLLPLLNLVSSGSGREYSSDNSGSFWFFQGRYSSHTTTVISIQARSLPSNLAFSLSKPPQLWRVERSLGQSSLPAPSSTSGGPVTSPNSTPSLRPHRHHHHWKRPHAVSPSPAPVSGCDQITCVEPLTSTPIGSPCGCVLPMKVELHVGVSLYEFFPLVDELEIEVAAGTYLKQSQVKIMGASADIQDQGKTVVDINLVPLGEKFDSTTAMLTYERFWHKKVTINATLFGDYEVIYIKYPGLPSSPPLEDSLGPVGSGDHENPIMADFRGKSQKMNTRTIAIIALSAFVLFLVCLGMVSILLKCKKVGRTSTSVGPATTSSITKRSGKIPCLSDLLIVVELIMKRNHLVVLIVLAHITFIS